MDLRVRFLAEPRNDRQKGVGLREELFAADQTTDVVEADEDDDGDEEHESHEMDYGLSFGRDSTAAAHSLDYYEEESATVQGGYGEEVEDGEVEAQDGDEADEGQDAGLGYFPGDLSNADGSGEALPALGGGEDVANG